MVRGPHCDSPGPSEFSSSCLRAIPTTAIVSAISAQNGNKSPTRATPTICSVPRPTSMASNPTNVIENHVPCFPALLAITSNLAAAYMVSSAVEMKVTKPNSPSSKRS